MYKDRNSKLGVLALAVMLMFTVSSFALYSARVAAADIRVTLAGDQEVPPVQSAGAGTGLIVIGSDGSVSGSVTSTGIVGIAAHIHEAAAGENGPAIISLTMNGNTYSVPTGAKLTEAQYASYQAGNLYVNVHTKAYPEGEIRGQLKP